MSDEWVRIAAPATTSNIGAGFDVFGLALNEPFDIIQGRKTKSDVQITGIEGPGSDSIPTDPERNSASIAASAVLAKCGADFGIEMRISKGIRPCSGIGSSGASAAGGAFLANILCGEQLSPDEVILCAAQAESATSGSIHADNVAPCVLGGFTIIRSYDPFEVINIQPPENLGLAVALPDIMVETSVARKVLPEKVSVKDLVFHVGHASSMVYGMISGDLGVIARSVGDRVFEPARTDLVPHLKDAEKAAVDAGALVSFLGGAGPCVMSFFDKEKGCGDAVAVSVKRVFTDNGIGCDTWVTDCGPGCRRI